MTKRRKFGLGRAITLEEFDAMVTVEPNTGCWILPFGGNDAYSHVTVKGWPGMGAHRLMLERSLGRRLGKMQALHRCDFKPCCNPDHLYAGTPSDNARDVYARTNAAQKQSAATKALWANKEWRSGYMAWMKRLAKARAKIHPKQPQEAQCVTTRPSVPSTGRTIPRDPRLKWRRAS